MLLAFLGIDERAKSMERDVIFGTLGYEIIGSINAVLYLYTPEIYPTRMRAIGTGLATSWLRISSAVGPALVGFMVGATGIHSVFLMFAGVSVVGAFACNLHGGNERSTPRGNRSVIGCGASVSPPILSRFSTKTPLRPQGHKNYAPPPIRRITLPRPDSPQEGRISSTPISAPHQSEDVSVITDQSICPKGRELAPQRQLVADNARVREWCVDFRGRLQNQK